MYARRAVTELLNLDPTPEKLSVPLKIEPSGEQTRTANLFATKTTKSAL